MVRLSSWVLAQPIPTRQAVQFGVSTDVAPAFTLERVFIVFSWEVWMTSRLA